MNSALGPYALLPDLLEFTIYGDQTILQAATRTADAAYDADQNISHGSLHKLLVHAMGAEWVWLNRFNNIQVPIYDHAAFPTRESLHARWPEVHTLWRNFLNAQTLDSLNSIVHFKTLKGEPKSGKLADLILHVTDHATYHRGQQNTLIKLAGGTPVNIFFYTWRSSGAR